MIEVARLHATEQNLPIDYRVADAESLVATHAGQFDIVTCMEMLEHVPNPAAMVATLAKLVRPGGSRVHLHHQSQPQVVPAGHRGCGICVGAHSRAARTSTSG